MINLITTKQIKHNCTMTEDYYSYIGQDKKAEKEIRKHLKQHYPFFRINYNTNNNTTVIMTKSMRSSHEE